MILELNINNSKEVFVNTHVTGMMYRDALYLRHKQVTEDFTPSLLDEMVGLVCKVFDNKFSIRDFYNGLDKREIFGVVNTLIDAVITQDCNSAIEREHEILTTESENIDETKTIIELQELFDKLCIKLMRQGYKINDIDNMDINYYLHLENIALKDLKKSDNNIKNGFIDDIL